MRRRKIETAIIAIFLLLFGSLNSGCEKLFFGDEPAHDPLNTFELTWKALDENYSYFDLKKEQFGVDWDSIKSVYEPMIREDMSPEELFAVLGDMLQELRDGHVNLRSGFDISKYLDYYLPYPRNFNFHLLEASYLGQDYSIVSPLIHREIDSIGYIRYGSFAAGIDEGDLGVHSESLSAYKGADH